MRRFVVQAKMMSKSVLSKRKDAEIESSLECVVCYSHFRGCEIFKCPNMHPLCTVCVEQLKHPKKCPECRVRFDNPPRRDRQLEQLVATIYKYKCKHDGCGYEGLDVGAHEYSCDYQLIECRLCCDDDGENCTHPEFRLKDYTQHLIEHHGDHGGLRNTRSAETPQTFIIGKSEDYSKNYFHFEYFSFGSVLFQLVVNWRGDGTHEVEHTVFCSVEPKETEKYVWKITYKKGNAFVGFCGTRFEPDWECDFNDRRCMCELPAFEAEQLKNTDGRLEGTFTISREV